MIHTASLKASLPMYDWPELSSQTDQLWQLIADVIADVIAKDISEHDLQPPEHLDRTSTMWESWMSPDCVFSQTCGWPYAESVYQHANLLVTLSTQRRVARACSIQAASFAAQMTSANH